MKIPGNLIADTIKQELKKQTEALLQKGIQPHLAVVIVGDDPASLTYIGRKKKVGEELGVKVTVHQLPRSLKLPSLLRLLNDLNENPEVHGIIIQRPVPVDITSKELDQMVIPAKDVDGFRADSPFTPPIATALLVIVDWVYNDTLNRSWTLPEWFSFAHREFTNNLRTNFLSWLREKKTLVIGRGETGGKPIADMLTKLNVPLTIAHSKTENIIELCLASDIVISCVGKGNIVRHDMVSPKTILIGVGMHAEGTVMKPDYDLDQIDQTVLYYTPVPGGVGPVNVVSLIANVVQSANSAQ